MATLLPRLTVLAKKTKSNAWDEKIMFEPRSAMEELGMNVGNDKLDHEKFWGRMQKVSAEMFLGGAESALNFDDCSSSSVMMVSITKLEKLNCN
jgi:hypothetical protein